MEATEEVFSLTSLESHLFPVPILSTWMWMTRLSTLLCVWILKIDLVLEIDRVLPVKKQILHHIPETAVKLWRDVTRHGYDDLIGISGDASFQARNVREMCLKRNRNYVLKYKEVIGALAWRPTMWTKIFLTVCSLTSTSLHQPR